MPVPVNISELAQIAGSNYPQGTDSPSTLDDVQRAIASFIALLRDSKGLTSVKTLASAGTVDIGGADSYAVEITGTTAITSFGTNYSGPRHIRFTGALTLTHNASLLNLPGAANITTAAGDTCLAIPNSTGNGWNVTSYQYGSYTPNSGANLVGTATGLSIGGSAATAATAGSANTANSAATLSAQSTRTPASFGTDRGPSGVHMWGVYANGYPTAYGNVLHLNANGSSQLLLGWSGDDGSHASNYIRSKRDNDTGPWSPWAELVTSANSLSYAPSPTGSGASGTWNINISGAANSAASASNLAGGAGGSIPYQTASGATSFIPSGAAGRVLVSAGASSPPVWSPFPDSVPIGCSFEWNGTTAPNSSWMIEDGRSLSKTAYPALFDVIQYTFGGSGDNFNIPNSINRVAVGATGLYAVGATGGSKDAIVVSHSHSVNDPGHGHSILRGDAGEGTGYGGGTAVARIANFANTSLSANNNVTGISLNENGQSGTNANMPPYIGKLKIIKVL